MKTIKEIFLGALLMIAASSYSQSRRETLEQVHSLKIAFITAELDLTSDEAAKFWPVYNAYEEKQREFRRKKINSFERDGSLDGMSEKEAVAALAQMESNEEDLFQLRKKFVGQLKTVLPAKKILKLRKAEEDFNKKLLKQYREKRRAKN